MKLPDSWVEVRLDEVCALNPRLPVNERPDDIAQVSFVPMSAVDEASGTISKLELRTFGEVAKGYTIFLEGDVLFAKVTPCMENGKAAIVGPLMNGLGFGSTEFHVLRPTEAILAEYLFHFIRQPAFRDWAVSAFVGTGGLQRVPPEFLARVKLPLPTLTEQQRIVDVLRQVTNLRQLKTEATKLIAKTGEALFEQHFGVAGATEEWPMEPFKKYTTYSKYGPRFPDQQYSENGIHVLRTTDMNDDGTIRWWEAPRLALSEKQIEEHALKPGTLVISRSGTIGPFALFDGEEQRCVAGAYLIEFGLADTIEPEYVRALFATPYIQRMLTNAARSMALPNINAPSILAIQLPVPPIDKQREFVVQIKALREMASELRSSVAQFDELLSVTTGQSYTGELTKNWRDQHHAEIATAAQIRDTLLRERGTKLTIRPPETAPQATPAKETQLPARTWLLSELSDFQRQVFDAFLSYPDQPLLAEDPDVFARFCESESLNEKLAPFPPTSPNHLRRTLSQLAALGLIAKVALPKTNTTTGQQEFLTAFRPLRPGEKTRAADVAMLRRSLDAGTGQAGEEADA